MGGPAPRVWLSVDSPSGIAVLSSTACFAPPCYQLREHVGVYPRGPLLPSYPNNLSSLDAPNSWIVDKVLPSPVFLGKRCVGFEKDAE